MDTIKNIVIFDGSLEFTNPDLNKFDRSKAIVDKVLLFLRSRDTNIIKKD